MQVHSRKMSFKLQWAEKRFCGEELRIPCNNTASGIANGEVDKSGSLCKAELKRVLENVLRIFDFV